MRRLFRMRPKRGSGQGKYLLASSIVLAIAVAPFAMASGEGGFLRLGARNPAGGGELGRETQIIASNGSWGTRQSNKGTGGGAIYGCRSAPPASGKAGTDNEPCVRGNNLTTGRAFEFNGVHGNEVGRITVGNDKGDDPSARPFSTNATGVATGLNADRVDGLTGDDLQRRIRFAAVKADGTLISGRGATSSTHGSADGTYQVKFDGDISACVYQATETETVDGGATAVEPLAATTDTLVVRTRSGGGPAGTDPTPPADRPFHLTVIC
jgi:hypothetical protein